MSLRSVESLGTRLQDIIEGREEEARTEGLGVWVASPVLNQPVFLGAQKSLVCAVPNQQNSCMGNREYFIIEWVWVPGHSPWSNDVGSQPKIGSQTPEW